MQGDGITVAVVDTGIDYNHPDIAANMVPVAGAADFADNANDPIDHFGHGVWALGDRTGREKLVFSTECRRSQEKWRPKVLTDFRARFRDESF